MTDEIIRHSSDASRGAYQNIGTVRGVFTEVRRVPSRFTAEESRFGVKDQAQATLEDAVILTMLNNEPEPELKDNKFVWWMTYAAPGKAEAAQSTFFARGFCKSAEELLKAEGKESTDDKKYGWYDLIGRVVTIQRKRVFLFKRPKAGGAEGEYDEFYQENFVFVADEGGGVGLDEHVMALVVGKNAQAAKRAVMMDSRAKSQPKYKDAIDASDLCDMLGLTVDDEGRYQYANS